MSKENNNKNGQKWKIEKNDATPIQKTVPPMPPVKPTKKEGK